MIVNVHEAKTHLSKLLDAASRGEDVVIAKDGKPFVRLYPLSMPPGKPCDHRDPFDRMLIARSKLEKMPLISSDAVFSSYDIEIIR